MRYIPFALALTVILSAHKCNEKTAAAVDAGTPTETVQKVASILAMKWVLTSIKGGPLNMPKEAEAPWIVLKREGDQLEGFGGCNSLFGTYAVEGSRIKFIDLGSTKKYCEATQGIETAFMQALRTSAEFKLEGGLMKLIANGDELAAFSKQ